ncbi:MAG: TonB family protein [Bacteroidota bacterium]
MSKYSFLIIFFLTTALCRSQDSPSKWVDPETPPILFGSVDSLKQVIRNLTTLTKDLDIGKVFVQFEVDTLGRVRNPNVIKGLGFEADSIALNIVRTLKFHPAEYNNKKIEVKRVFPIEFVHKSNGI